MAKLVYCTIYMWLIYLVVIYKISPSIVGISSTSILFPQTLEFTSLYKNWCMPLFFAHVGGQYYTIPLSSHLQGRKFSLKTLDIQERMSWSLEAIYCSCLRFMELTIFFHMNNVHVSQPHAIRLVSYSLPLVKSIALPTFSWLQLSFHRQILNNH